MTARRSATTELAAFRERFAWHGDPDLLAWITALRTGVERTLFGAWLACANGVPMLLVLGADLRGADQGSEAHRQLILATCACVRLALVHIPPNEPRPAQSLEIVERWARGDPSADLDEAQRIVEAARAVRYAGWAVWRTAWAAQDAVQAARNAASAARHTAWIAREAASAQGASEADAAYRDAHAQCADLIRREFPRPPYRDPITGAEDEATYWLEIVDDPSIDPAARRAAGVRVLEIEAEIQGG